MSAPPQPLGGAGAVGLDEAIAHVVLGTDTLRAGDASDGERTLSPADVLDLVARCAAADGITTDLLADSVAAARHAGHSWAAIGDVLGLSRQGVQQRFGTPAVDESTGHERWLGPVTAFDEMHELELAGRQGWRTVGAGMLRHRMLRTDTQWEHRRVLWLRPTATYEVDGWQVGCHAFPWLYLVRDRGLEPEPPSTS